MEPLIIGLIIFCLAILVGLVLALFAWYRVVPPSEAHMVVTPSKRMTCSSDPNIAKNGGASTYFAIPEIPFIGRKVRVMDVTNKELVVEQETYEKGQARYMVTSSLKYRIQNVEKAAETFISDEELKKQLIEVVKATVRAVTVKTDVVQARANKTLMTDEIKKEIIDDLEGWGLKLVNFQLVDFQDTETSKIISNISKRREVEIETETRERNAEKFKQAKIKEAEADELSQKREIERDEVVAMRKQNLAQRVSEQEKLAKEKEFAVKQVEIVKAADIEKERAIVEANQKKEQEKIMMEQKRLEGEGDKLRDMEKAKGVAAPIREKGFAEAEAKEKLQAALNKFGDKAIRALVAEKVVAMQETIGVETAKALAAGDVKVFAGGQSAKNGFDFGALIESMQVSSGGLAQSVLHRIKQPNDLGIGDITLGKEEKTVVKKVEKPSIPTQPAPTKTPGGDKRVQ